MPDTAYALSSLKELIAHAEELTETWERTRLSDPAYCLDLLPIIERLHTENSTLRRRTAVWAVENTEMTPNIVATRIGMSNKTVSRWAEEDSMTHGGSSGLDRRARG